MTVTQNSEDVDGNPHFFAHFPNDRLLQRFARFHKACNQSMGTGLGLAIVHEIVIERHRGLIQVNSGIGQGTEFVIAIPLQAKVDSQNTRD